MTILDLLSSTAPALPSIGIRERLSNLWTRRRHYRETVKALDSLSDHVLADVGLTRDGIFEAARRVCAAA